MPLLEVNDLHFGYSNNYILKGISFKIERGQVMCLFGPNGCGKTTLLDCILGINKYSKGKIYVNNIEIEKYTATELARNIAYVPQKHSRTFPYRVIDIVLMGRTAYTSTFSSPGSDDYKIAEESLKKVGMYSFKDRIFSNLSGGEAQLVKIARALAQNTKILIFDEPTSRLDFRHELHILRNIVDLIRNNEIAIIMATHFPNHAYFLENNGVNTEVAMIENGVFGAVGTASQVLNEENMNNIFKVGAKVLSYKHKNRKMNYIIPTYFNGR